MYEKGFAYLLQAEHEKVIYGVLKRLNVTPRSVVYEDLIVEGQIAFAQAYCAYEQTHAQLIEAQVMPYIYQKVKWRLLDLLRKQTRLSQRECGGAQELIEGRKVRPLAFSDLETYELVEQLWASCTPNERRFLALRAETELSVTEIAKKLAVSRKMVYKYRRNIWDKLAKLS